MQEKKLSFAQCIIVNNWYQCPISIMIFVFFLILFVYSIYIMSVNFKDIMDLTKTQRDNKQLKRLEKLYIVNLLTTFISFAVVILFIARAIGDLTFMKVMNKFVILIVIIFIVLVSSYNISVYNQGNVKGTQTLNGIILGISLLILCISIFFYYYGSHVKQFLGI